MVKGGKNMEGQPILYTERLLLRPFSLDDAKRVQELAGDIKVATYTINIPHPYEDGVAEHWISTHNENLEQNKSVTYAVVIDETQELIGAISLMLNLNHKKAEIGYWFGVSYWNKGYCTEAAREMIKLGFEQLDLNKIFACAVVENIGSWRVMEKAGMSFEGIRRQDVLKWGEFKDLKYYYVLKEDYKG
jgi:RimJ/RimL family protein N-acetyltransferase